MPVRAGIALAAALLMAPTGLTAPAKAATNLLPDMMMAPIYDIQLTTSARGRTKLRFGTVAFNVGDGPMEVRAGRRDGRYMTEIAQWLYRSDGTGHAVPKPDATVFFRGDGHDHWHVERFFSVRLSPRGNLRDDQTLRRRIRKIGFCLVDSRSLGGAARPPNAADRPSYFVCGDAGSRRIKIGVSVGWGDDYPPDFVFQSINVSGLPQGQYRLCATVNPRGLWTEKDDNRANNSHWLDLDLDVARMKVAITGSGDTRC